MYSKAIINAVKEDFARRCGWMPEEHSIDEVDEFNEYIEDIVDIKKTKTTSNYFWNLKSKRLNGKAPTEKRIEWLKRWRQNEKFLCFSDAEYFVTRYARIRNVKEAIIRLEYRKAQIIFHKILARYDDRQVAIQLFCSSVGKLDLDYYRDVLPASHPAQDERSRDHGIGASSPVGQVGEDDLDDIREATLLATPSADHPERARAAMGERWGAVDSGWLTGCRYRARFNSNLHPSF